MSTDALLPCIVCGKELRNVFQFSNNQPYEATEFLTYGHYGSTFWDSFDGESLRLNICDEHLRAHPERLGRQKDYRPVKCEGMIVGREPLDRPLITYFDGPEDSSEPELNVEVSELGTRLGQVEWFLDRIDEIKEYLQETGVE